MDETIIDLDGTYSLARRSFLISSHSFLELMHFSRFFFSVIFGAFLVVGVAFLVAFLVGIACLVAFLLVGIVGAAIVEAVMCRGVLRSTFCG